MKCLRTTDAGTFAQEMCSACKAIPNLPSFKKRLLLRSRSSDDEGERNLDKIRNDFLTPAEMVRKLRDQEGKLQQENPSYFSYKQRTCACVFMSEISSWWSMLEVVP